jgi:hypothetical protein
MDIPTDFGFEFDYMMRIYLCSLNVWCKGIPDTYIGGLFGNCIMYRRKKLAYFFNVNVQHMISQNVIQGEQK